MIADRNMGINSQVAVLLEALSLEESHCEIPDNLWMSTSPYGNCRERGFVLSFNLGLKHEHLAFFEHRNSDELCCVRWKGPQPISGVFRYEDIDPKAYPYKYAVTRSWPRLCISEAVRYVHDVIREIVGLK